MFCSFSNQITGKNSKNIDGIYLDSKYIYYLTKKSQMCFLTSSNEILNHSV